MEWLGILLLYLISGFMKKRQQDAKKREIESDPEWDPDKNDFHRSTDSPNSLEQLLNDLFEQNPKTPEIDPLVRESVQNINIKDKEEVKRQTEKINSPIIEEQDEDFDEKIYHSKLADRDEQHFGNKWKKKVNIGRRLFKSKKSLRKSIIVKEILDKPIAFKK
tara:strand:- start:427 stop:915 length:489 start_codon:yes stop_codon:yes gene_type:complete